MNKIILFLIIILCLIFFVETVFSEYNILHNFIKSLNLENKEYFYDFKINKVDSEIIKESNVPEESNSSNNEDNFKRNGNKIHNNYFDVNVDVKARDNKLGSLKNLDLENYLGKIKIPNLINQIKKSVKNEINPTTTPKAIQNPKRNEFIKKDCEQTIIDVSYPKMYFRNEYPIKNSRLNYMFV